MNKLTFSECYCTKYNIPKEKYARAALSKALYPHARLIKPLLTFLDPQYFAADFDLIFGVENLSRLRDFKPEAVRFNEHPQNRGLFRRTLRIRVSTSRLRELIQETMSHRAGQTNPGLPEENGTMVPFERPR